MCPLVVKRDLKVLLIKRETGRERRKDKTGKKEDVDD